MITGNSSEPPTQRVSARSKRALMIIVTYNSFDAVNDIIDSVARFEDANTENFSIVVENSSDGRLVEAVTSGTDPTRTKCVLASRNDGFSHGVNLGADVASATWGSFDFVVLLNPDVLQAGETMALIVDRARCSDGDVGVSGALLRDESGRIDRGCARRDWNRRRFFSHLIGVPELAKFLGTKERTLNERDIRSPQRDLAILSGASMCISAKVFKNGLDTLLPMYLEDQEICLRSRSLGLKVVLHGDLELVHLGGVSRKSATAHDHALRIMELVEAPVLCMARHSGYRSSELRAIVFLGGLLRFLVAISTATVRGIGHSGSSRFTSSWLDEQRTLSRWYMKWALSGKLHREDVSLEEYFSEFSALRS